MAIADVRLKNGWTAIYDESFKKKIEKSVSSLGVFKSVAGNYINFNKNGWIGTYDINLRKISEKHM